MKKQNAYIIVGGVLSAIFIAAALISLVWTPCSPTAMSGSEKFLAPSAAHLMGTDNFGRDILSRCMVGVQMTVLVALAVVAASTVIGVAVGCFTGYYGGMADEIIMRFNDALNSFPSIFLALVIIGVAGSGKYKIIVALVIVFIPSFVRIARSEMIKYKNMDFVKSARIMGVKDMRIIFVHILPNMIPTLLVSVIIGFNNAVLAEAGMSYLGIGVQPPDASLGRMLSEAQGYLFSAPWYPMFPGILIVLLILGFSLLGEGVRKIV